MTPTLSAARGRDIAMAVSGAVILGAGVTFVIKTGKTPSKQAKPEAKLEIRTWNPNINPSVKYDPLHR